MNAHLSKKRIILCGLGTVGQGLWKIIQKIDAPIEIAGVFDRSINQKSEITSEMQKKFPQIMLTDKFNEIWQLENISAVIELIGGIDTAYSIVQTALERLNTVITANKALLATHGEELFALSQKRKTYIYYEASVAGAVPILQNIQKYFVHQEVKTVQGILNSTTNFILSNMLLEKNPFSSILAKAQQAGLAEAIPTLDIDGTDAIQKLALIFYLIYGTWVKYQNLYYKGITDIYLSDILWSQYMGYKVKLISSIKTIETLQQKDQKKLDKLFCVSTEPTLVSQTHFLSQVDQANNAIYLQAEFSGNHLFMGEGAGAYPTAYAVYSDIMEAISHQTSPSPLSRSSIEPHQSSSRNLPSSDITFLPHTEIESRFYIRITVEDRTGVLAIWTQKCNDQGISLLRVHQDTLPEISYAEKTTDLVCITHNTYKKNILQLLDTLTEDSFLVEEPQFFPVLDY